tara:strand:- start:1918 stop:2754 length:837 start_codon:yes stop_codon:yes gene_type:complete
MADLKISALPASTTPLAGTEVLPIVQSSTTKQVSVANLTAGRAVSTLSLSTTEGYTFRGADFTTYELLRVIDGTVNPGLFVNARAATKDVQLFATGSSVAGQRLMLGAENVVDSLRISATDVTVAYGNLVIGTSGKGIDFSATPGTGTSELLADYEEGTWTPVYDSLDASFTYDEQYGWYVRVGALVTIQCRIKAATATGTTSNGCRVSGLPFATGSLSALSSTPGSIGLSTFPTTLAATTNNASSIITLWQAGTTNQPTAANAVGAFFTLSMTYRAA